MAERAWTGPQSDAITARGGSVLVSAAAGSGKTAVLVERVVCLICDEQNPVDADRLLVVTFSRAAAAEMKQRMGERLAAMIRDNPHNLHLQRQQALLAGAQVSTVHSFCLDLVRQNFQELEVSPDFAVIDQNELEVLQNDCVADCVACFYEEDESGVLPELIELLSSGRDDRKLHETILRIYEFSRSHPFPDDWLDETLAMYSTELPVAETVWGRSILAFARESLAYCRGLAVDALEIICGEEKMQKAYESAFRSDLAQLERCSACADAGDWDGAVAALAAFTFDRLGSLRGENPEKERVKAMREQVKDTVKDLAAKYMNATGEQFREDLADLRPRIALLFEMVRDYSERLWQAKADKRRLNFSDLEHLALSLLVEKTEHGFRPTEQARAVAERYDCVLVDEYQDTNEVQDMIFTCVSQNQRNLFMVGDVKQSIYSFRQAMPEIFIRKKEVFFPYAATGQYPAKIILDTNFRSRAQVTGAVNGIFGSVMSARLGDVDYNGEESLKCGAVYPPYDHAQPELLLVDAENAGQTDGTVTEAREIARKVEEMLSSGYLVAGREGMRPARPGDFCVLMRSPRGRAETYIKEFARRGIVARAENTGGYLSSREVSSVVSFLRALDNPLLDIELVAAMLSPLFDFSDDDITRIRLAARGGPFFTAVHAAARVGDEKAAAFLQTFSRLRAEAAVLPADRLILRVYEETDALAVFRAMRMGETRRANLLLLVEYAASYHAMGYKQLSGFVGFLARVAERDGDLAPAANLGESADAVRVMSIHRSKGLEFPVVILADTARSFNLMDLRQNTLLHAKYGFACVRRDQATFKQFPTVPMQAIRVEARRSLLSEEMRVLYVALTRAREKLIISGVVKKGVEAKLSGLCHAPEGGKLPPFLLEGCTCYLDWVLMSLLHHPSCAALRELAHADGLDLFADDGNAWRVSVVRPGAERQKEETAAAPAEPAAAQPDPQLLQQLRESARWVYPHLAETRVPTKFAVSDVAKGKQDVSHRFQARPKFLMGQKLTPAERGNAMHRFMQFADYEAARDNLEGEIARMRGDQFLSAVECDSLDLQKLEAFFRSPLAKRIFASEKVYRELKFAAECGHDMLGDLVEGIGDSKVVLQGVADCVFLEDGAAVIVDYKTDRVSTVEELQARYSGQLELYRRILGQSLGVPVKQCVLYSFHLLREVEV